MTEMPFPPAYLEFSLFHPLLFMFASLIHRTFPPPWIPSILHTMDDLSSPPVLVSSPEKQNQNYIKEIYYKEMAYAIMKAKRSHDPLSIS